ncbi:MAG: discoidin domain-containing protein [Clostridia bacterium]|nr:discoidin domain-containing protein [Clostridia bacterium]
MDSGNPQNGPYRTPGFGPGGNNAGYNAGEDMPTTFFPDREPTSDNQATTAAPGQPYTQQPYAARQYGAPPQQTYYNTQQYTNATSQYAPAGPPPTPPKKDHKTAIIISVIAAVVAVAAVAIIAVAVQSRRSVPEAVATVQPAADNAAAATDRAEADAPRQTEAQAGLEIDITSALPTDPMTEPAVTSAPIPDQATAATQAQAYSAPVIASAATLSGSVLPSSNVSSSRSFGADQAIDGYAETCWCVNTDSSGGAGGSLEIRLAGTALISGIGIVNGNLYLPDEGLYAVNGQVRTFSLKFSDGSSVSLTADYNPDASTQYQYFRFDSPVAASSFILTVESGYPGTKYTTNVCIGEITVF